MVLNWPLTSVTDRYIVQWRNANSSMPWTDMPGSQVIGKGRFWMTNQMSGPHRFFRLVRRR